MANIPDGFIDATPSKRLYLSIIADYDVNKSVCELIDNALDLWVKGEMSNPIEIAIELNIDQQRICVTDNAGGLDRNELSYIVGPGQTGNLGDENTIGIFGVGTKRAVVALAQDITIKTRKNASTYLIKFDDTWLKDAEDWQLPVQKTNNIQKETTNIELVRLRTVITDELINELKIHLAVTYAYFLIEENVKIKVNGEEILPKMFNNWAYPPKYVPIEYSGIISTQSGQDVNVYAIAGLILESSPSTGEYGVYIYCNNRLIAKSLKTLSVGFETGLAGKPHADISLVRVLVFIDGPAKMMPWNSSKSGINPSHFIFKSLQTWLINVVKDYASLSRRFSKMQGGWKKNVFPYTTGEKKSIKITNFPDAKTSYLPPLPLVQPRFKSLVKQKNESIIVKKPWTIGLMETIIVVNWVLNQDFEQRNRIALILLDSNLEIAFKEYLLRESGEQYSEDRISKLFSNRVEVQKEMKKFLQFDNDFWKKVNYYYHIRCDLVHKRSTSSLSNSEINEYCQLVEDALHQMFDLSF